ncbi:hypothetical protein ACTXKZ_15170 [Brachybacterium alimentarium]|uniref:hypothetical protein n=1 Tax=Brachybacterium alimentarium TaxID=47845 RepID=UPI003FD177DD
MSTPHERVDDATRRLLDLLERGESLSLEAVDLRAELAVATAESGQLEDAFFQVDELLKDAQREHGPEHDVVSRVRSAVAEVETLARRSIEGS